MSNVTVLAFMLGVVLYLLVRTMVRVYRMTDDVAMLVEIAHRAPPNHPFSPAWVAGCRCAKCRAVKAGPHIRTSSGPLEDDRPVGEVLPPGVSPTAPAGAPTSRVVVSGTASEVAAVIASELLGLPDAYASALRIHLRGNAVPCTDPACRRPHRLVSPS
ncbi:MAG TPA: hypothetical protein VMV41_12355 [Cellulomonadaceae bacterium]|nr:hypothetical protein [Cellulomonadaceae bacterium]